MSDTTGMSVMSYLLCYCCSCVMFILAVLAILGWVTTSATKTLGSVAGQVLSPGATTGQTQTGGGSISLSTVTNSN